MSKPKKMKVGIIGSGWIAEKMAITLQGLAKDPATQDCIAYAIASRSQEKADAFAKEWGFQKAYGSYEALVADPEVDLVYIATPHSHHYAQRGTHPFAHSLQIARSVVLPGKVGNCRAKSHSHQGTDVLNLVGCRKSGNIGGGKLIQSRL